MLKKTMLLSLTISAITIQTLTDPAYAQIIEVKLESDDLRAEDEFGKSVSMSGDYIVVGARKDDGRGTNSGSAYVFKRTNTTWALELSLPVFDLVPWDEFGVSVSISGDYIVVGTDGGGWGLAYVYKRTGTSWTQEEKLLVSRTADDQFGHSVSISGDYIVVGADHHDESGSISGSAYVFKRSGTSWVEEAKLLTSD